MYPFTAEDKPAGVAEDSIFWDLLKMTKLEKIGHRYSLDTPQYWDRILSGGEMQRLGFARLFYHQPAFAFMDEATSAMDIEMEQGLLQRCIDTGITMVSIVHRTSSVDLHNKILCYSKVQQERLEEARRRSKVRAQQEEAPGRVSVVATLVTLEKDEEALSRPFGKTEEDAGSAGGIDEAFWRRLKMIFSLTFTDPFGRPAIAVYIAMICRGLAACLTIEATDVAGNMLAQLSDGSTSNEEFVDIWGNVPTKLVIMYGNCFIGMLFQGVACWFGLLVALYVRAAIQEHIHKLYFKKKVAYCANQLDPSIDTIDQRITQDLELLTVRLQAAVFGSPENPTSGRPGVICGIFEMLTLITYGFWLNWLVASTSLGILLVCSFGYTVTLSWVGKETLPVQNSEGLLRYWHLRIRDFAEPIAFFKGENAEAECVNGLLGDVYKARLRQLQAYIPLLFTANIFGYMQIFGTLWMLSFVALYLPSLGVDSSAYGTQISFFFHFWPTGGKLRIMFGGLRSCHWLDPSDRGVD
jgi:ABC-type uncharacterized transport system fused permease/ATPase subunit